MSNRPNSSNSSNRAGIEGKREGSDGEEGREGGGKGKMTRAEVEARWTGREREAERRRGRDRETEETRLDRSSVVGRRKKDSGCCVPAILGLTNDLFRSLAFLL